MALPMTGLPADMGVDTWLAGYEVEVTSRGIEVTMLVGTEVIEGVVLAWGLQGRPPLVLSDWPSNSLDDTG